MPTKNKWADGAGVKTRCPVTTTGPRGDGCVRKRRALAYVCCRLPALTGCREIKSYRLIDLSAVDPPAESPPSFDSSAFFSSHLESSLHSIADQDFTQLGRSTCPDVVFTISATIDDVSLFNAVTSRPHRPDLRTQPGNSNCTCRQTPAGETWM